MPRLTSISTGKGDDGTTSLGSRQRVAKDAARIQANGTVDELNSVIGLAIATGLCNRLMDELPLIQNELFRAGADLTVLEHDPNKEKYPRIEARHVSRLTELVRSINQELEPLENFILPGGSPGAAQLQVARAVCRRAERKLVTLAQEEEINPRLLPYLNRLSDLLFLMARMENLERGVSEPLWDTTI
jgi:cob(I)alamin adenosyltransferase